MESTGVAFAGVDASVDLYPTVSLHGIGEVVRCNFGKKPFAYDATQILVEDERAMATAIDEWTVPVSHVDDLVRQYLQYYGYADTLRALSAPPPAAQIPRSAQSNGTNGATSSSANGSSNGTNGASKASGQLHERCIKERVRALVQSGNMIGAMQLIDEHYPGIFEPLQSSDTLFQLRCQHFLELVKSGAEMDAIAYAREHIKSLCDVVEGQEDATAKLAHLERVMGTLAYPHVENAPPDIQELVSDKQRELVADCVNAAIMRAASGDGEGGARSDIERVLCHLMCTRDVFRMVRGGRGDVFALPVPDTTFLKSDR